jgi:hypothetical protein
LPQSFGQSVIDVVILKIFSPKMKKNMRFAQTNASFCKNEIITLCFFTKTPFFRRKLAKFAQNCDHSIGPWFKFDTDVFFG